MIEHCAGNFPLWLAPVQVRLLPVNDVHEDFARELMHRLKRLKVRVELIPCSNSLGRRVKQVRIDKIPIALVIGDKEVQSNRVAVRERGKDEVRSLELDDCIKEILAKIACKEN